MEDISKKAQNVLFMSDDEKYDYFVRKVADFEEVWGLYKDEGWALLADEKGEKVFPFWPEKEFAQINSVDTWKDYKPKAIKLDEFMSKWLPGLKRDNISLSIFYNSSNSLNIKTATEVEDDIGCELEQYD